MPLKKRISVHSNGAIENVKTSVHRPFNDCIRCSTNGKMAVRRCSVIVASTGRDSNTSHKWNGRKSRSHLSIACITVSPFNGNLNPNLSALMDRLFSGIIAVPIIRTWQCTLKCRRHHKNTESDAFSHFLSPILAQPNLKQSYSVSN